MQARYYDPTIGRFLSIDPAGFSVDDPMSFGRYSYANNNPIINFDPDGRDTVMINPIDLDIVLLGGGGITVGFFYDDGKTERGKGRDIGLVLSFRAGVGADLSVGSTAGRFLGSASEMVGISDYYEVAVLEAEGQVTVLPDGSTRGTEVGLSVPLLPSVLTGSVGKELTGKIGLRDVADGVKYVGSKLAEAAEVAAEIVKDSMIICPESWDC